MAGKLCSLFKVVNSNTFIYNNMQPVFLGDKRMNSFLNAMGSKNTVTWNNAISNSTSGVTTLDYFAKCGSYRGRTVPEVNSDMAAIFGSDPLTATKILFYNRLITRKSKGFNHQSETVQRGQGQRDEFIKSLAWLENNYPDILYQNLFLVPIVGSWRDLWYDSAATKFHYYINTDRAYELVRIGLQSEYHRALIAKYLPKIRSRRNTKNDRHRRLNVWGRGLCKYLGWSEAEYRKFKSNSENTAHTFQRMMCNGDWDSLDFNTVSGKALFNLISQTGKDGQNAISRHNLEDKYLNWIQSQPVAKFTGYPYELYKAAKSQDRTLVQKYTFDKQFDSLIEKAKDSINPDLLQKGVLCALDTSGSMGYMGSYGWNSTAIQPIDICVGLGIYFATLLEGHFHNHVIMFSDNSEFKQLTGESFTDKCDQIASAGWAMGSTNFQSVIDEIIRVRKQNPHIPVEDYPQVLLVVSDMQFNPCGPDLQTNYEVAKHKLQAVGLPEMTIIWWQVNGRFTGDVPSTNFDPGTVLISGFDGAIVTSILGGIDEVIDEDTGEKRKPTPEEVMKVALDQEVLNNIVI
jgi:hypothetical protein